MSHPDLERALNSELAYTTALVYFTRDFETLAKNLLVMLASAYPE